MKKILSIALIVVSIFAFVGCSPGEPSASDIMKGIKDQVTADLKASGVADDQFKDGIPGYVEANLVKDEENPIAKLFTKEDIKEGFVLQHKTDQNSNLIIVLKAKDEEKIDDLKKVLAKIKVQQDTTWKEKLPKEYSKVEANITKTSGKYLIYATYDDSSAIEKVFDKILKTTE